MQDALGLDDAEGPRDGVMLKPQLSTTYFLPAVDGIGSTFGGETSRSSARSLEIKNQDASRESRAKASTQFFHAEASTCCASRARMQVNVATVKHSARQKKISVRLLAKQFVTKVEFLAGLAASYAPSGPLAA